MLANESSMGDSESDISQQGATSRSSAPPTPGMEELYASGGGLEGLLNWSSGLTMDDI